MTDGFKHEATKGHELHEGRGAGPGAGAGFGFVSFPWDIHGT